MKIVIMMIIMVLWMRVLNQSAFINESKLFYNQQGDNTSIPRSVSTICPITSSECTTTSIDNNNIGAVEVMVVGVLQRILIK